MPLSVLGHARQLTTCKLDLSIQGPLLAERGRVEEAEPLLGKCAQIHGRLNLHGEEAWLATQADSTLGWCLLAQQRFEEAEPLLLQSYSVIHAAKGDRFTGTRTGLDRLIALYQAWGKPERATRWRVKRLLIPPLGDNPEDSSSPEEEPAEARAPNPD